MAAPMHTPDDAFWSRFDRERARVLRLRIVIYCLLALVAFGLSLLGNIGDWAEARGRGEAITGVTILNFSWDGAMAALYGAMLVYLLAARPDRRRLVLFLTVLTVLAVAASAPLEGFTDLLDTAAMGELRRPRVHAGWMAAASTGFLVVLAMVLVPMRLTEWARIAVPGWVIACVAILAVAGPPAKFAIVQCGATGAALALAGAWSTWRHRDFDERFRSREVAAQLGDLSAELAYARRIHEALFPPPIESGPLRIAYRYEPMRAIGGDFLFVWPLAFPPSQAPGPVHIVLIDVSGHGVSAALTVNRLHDELRRFFAGRPAGGAGELISDLNRFVYEQLSPHGVFATALCLRVDPQNGEVDYANAGHPPAVVRRGENVSEMPATAPMLGAVEPELFSPVPRSFRLDPGQSVFAFTDGAFEASDATGTPVGLDRLRGVIARTREGPRGVAAAIADLRSGPATDDILVVEVAMGGAE